VNLPKLAESVAAGLELSGPVEPVLASGVWALGRRHLAGRFREFFLLAGVDEYTAPTLIPQVDRIAMAVSPVLLVPSHLGDSDDVDQSFRCDTDQIGAKRRRALSV
jgi:hypothetical protein